MKIEIKGVEFSNKGAELMLYSIVQVLNEQFPDYELVLSPGYLLPYQKRAKLGAWQKFSFQCLGINWTWLGNLAPARLRRQLQHFGIVVEKDIDVVLDASGFVYSDKWGEQRLKQTLNHLKRIARYKTRYIFLPQAFGPFQHQRNQGLMTQLIDTADLIIARDDYSLQCLNCVSTLDGTEKIRCFPDFTPLLDAQDTILSVELPQNFVCIIPNNKIISHNANGFKQVYLNFLAEAIMAVASIGLTPVLLNHEGEKDHDICLKLLDKAEQKPLYLNDLSTLEIKRIIALSVFCLSSRFHACISSLSQGVPVLGTGWSHKYETLYHYYQCPDYLIEINGTSAGLKEKMMQIVAERAAISSTLLKQSEIHKMMIRKMWLEVFNSISQ